MGDLVEKQSELLEICPSYFPEIAGIALDESHATIDSDPMGARRRSNYDNRVKMGVSSVDGGEWC